MTRVDPIVGRYIYVDVQGVEYRVYVEEAGQGVPLLLQHTAGADGRQWRHLLCDTEIGRDFRMIAYDLPYHGKSLPPESVAWWTQEYRLTRDSLMDSVIAIARALDLDRPVYMGSSIGGHLAADLALYHPEQFRAVIGLEAALATPGHHRGLWNHPRISNAGKASSMIGLTAPSAPERYRREVGWVYSQGAPPVFEGDLYYYSVDHDLRGCAERIATNKIPVYLLTGEYDYATPPSVSAELAEQIAGARFTPMEGLGHFPMSEDPERFKHYIMPVLAEIRVRG